MKKIVYADGSSLGNPGKGGWAFLVMDVARNLIWEFGGREDGVTNNQMELRAMLESLLQLHKSKHIGEVEFRLDSQYVIKGVTEWSKGWVKNGWKTANKKDVLNKDLWVKILEAKHYLEAKGFEIEFTHVFGHTGERWNERVDEIAKSMAEKLKIDLKAGECILD